MKIKRVEIVGFKSFVDRVSLDFQEGITAVVGPNGCGKSNIVDAIRWAMGEQNARHLRGRSMEDVIFGGSETRKPLGMAEVSMVFSNADGLAPPAFREYAEIMVTRRLYRNGDSEYLLNKTPCRLRDITELFMDTGVGTRAYSVIEQGRIGMILNAKPEDRRFLIEEAAGVTKFKSRKKTALRKIEATRQNLVRLSDIIAEVRRQMNSLRRQAQKAERYRACREELKEIETRFARERHHALLVECETLAGQEKERQREQEKLGSRLEQGELRLEELRLQQAAQEKEVNQRQEKTFHLTAEIQKVEGRIEFGGKEIENLQRQEEQLAGEREDIRKRLADLDREEQQLRQGCSDLEAELESESRRLAEGESFLEEFADREQELSATLERTRGELYHLLTELSQIGSRQQEAQRRLRELEERHSRNRAEAVSVREQHQQTAERAEVLQDSLQQLRQGQAELQQEREELREALTGLRRRSEETENGLMARQEERNRQQSRLESLQQLEKGLEGYDGGVKSLLSDPELRRRFPRMLADLLEVPPRYEAAVEAVVGERLQALVAEDFGHVRQAVETLRRQEGRCTFLLPGFPAGQLPAVPEGRPLVEVIGVAEAFAEPLEALLAGVFLVESLDGYVRSGVPAGATLVTEEGEVLTDRGEFIGGGRAALDQGLLHRKREMKELAEQVESLNGQVAQLQEERQHLRDETAGTEERLSEVEAALHRQELRVVDGEKDLSRLQDESRRLDERIEVLSLEEDQLHEEQEELERQQEEASRGTREKEARKKELEAAVTRVQEELQEVREEAGTVRERVTTLKVAVASIREREESSRRGLERLAQMRRELRERLTVLQKREEEGEGERERLRTERERLRTELEVLFRKREEEKRDFDRVRERFEADSGQIAAQEESLKTLREANNRVREAVNELQLQQRELHMEADHLRQTFLERYRVDLAELAEPADPGGDDERQAGEARIAELRRQIDAFGEVNLTAAEEYRELEERSGFLTEQQEDLRQSLEGLQAAISKINRTTRKRFRETFEQVNAKFQEVFPRLFRGGQAELKLTDADDLLETGIDIVVQPPGKKLQNVGLLSGGEKALTAVALIFSIFLIKPSPFCLLDEVDAPLDDANIGRFNELVKEMADRSQFIIVTHNKRTMEIGDTMYGVTMEEAGVSRLVSVRLNDVVNL